MKNITLLLILFPMLLLAQNGQKYEKIKALKIAFITEKINLTPEEAKDFWPVYNQYSDEIRNLHRKELGNLRKEIFGKKESITEKEAVDFLKKEEEINEKIQTANKEMDKKLRKVISAKKLLFLKEAEREFYNNLMKQSRGK
ncbi:MAG: sensor of ECF-type sigma factor [Capnocytophaga sp.]|nr:sensor of ECF-type sigma factor [Capnocytophaga sp.]